MSVGSRLYLLQLLYHMWENKHLASSTINTLLYCGTSSFSLIAMDHLTSSSGSARKDDATVSNVVDLLTSDGYRNIDDVSPETRASRESESLPGQYLLFPTPPSIGKT